jgi:glycosyltransferase involved in cell wall biosynthesis
VGGIKEVVLPGETGILVPVRDHDAMASAIVRLLKDPALGRRMGDAGCARVRRRFSATRMVRETLRLYQRVAMHPHQESTHDDRMGS